MTEEQQYSDPRSVLKIVETIEQNGLKRAQDRAMINAQFNGARPYTDEEVEENQIQVNVNRLDGYKSAMDANLQVDGALLNKDRFFVVKCVGGDPEKRDEYGEIFTKAIHKPLKKGQSGRKHLVLIKNRNRSLTLHGIGGMVWPNRHDWMPKFVPLEDWLVPVEATIDMSDDLGHFGFNSHMTPYQLFKMTHGPDADPGWNTSLADKILTSMPSAKAFTPDLMNRPEEIVSLMKQHSAFMNSDAVPKVKISFFFYQDTETGKWYRKVIFRKTEGIGVSADSLDKFLYEKAEPFADSIENICHFQFGDGNVVAPLKFHSVRGLGILLFALVELNNRFYCQTMQHALEQLMAILRIQNPTTTDRPKVLMLKPYGVMEDGISFVRKEERHQADPAMIEYVMAQNRQLMAESSSSYVQDIDTGTQKEQTLGEAQIRLQSANKIVGGMLANIYLYEAFYYEEILRRFLMPLPTNKDIEKFQSECKAKGIPSDLMKDLDAWEIDVEKVFGMGDQTLAIQEVTALMGIINQLDPQAQRTVRRKYIATITRNPDLAMRLVPDEANPSTAGRQAAEDVFGTLMRGIPVALREGIEQQDYIIAMTEMMAQEIHRIQATDNVGTEMDVLGLQAVANDIGQHVQLLEQDPAMKPFVAGIDKVVGKLMNDVKGFAQRQAQAKESEQIDPVEAAKLQMEQMKAQVKMETQQQMADMKLQMQHEKHLQQMMQSEERHRQQMAALSEQTDVQIESQQVRTASDIVANKLKTDAAIQQSQKKAESDIAVKASKSTEPTKAKADAPPAINLTVNMPKTGKTRIEFERDGNGRIIGATKE